MDVKIKSKSKPSTNAATHTRPPNPSLIKLAGGTIFGDDDGWRQRLSASDDDNDDDENGNSLEGGGGGG